MTTAADNYFQLPNFRTYILVSHTYVEITGFGISIILVFVRHWVIAFGVARVEEGEELSLSTENFEQFWILFRHTSSIIDHRHGCICNV